LNISTGRNVSGKPPEELGKIPRPGRGTNGFGNTAPNIFCCMTQEEQMQDRFFYLQNWQKGLSVHPLSVIVSLVAMALCHISHSQTLIFRGILAFHKYLKDLSIPALERSL
jgi:hypothetical protein